MPTKSFVLAGPSFVLPGRIPENVLALKDHVSEVGLTLFNSGECLEYSSKDLPDELADNGLSYHVHLPLDLEWNKGAQHVLDVVHALNRKTSYLAPSKYVLHPPDSAELMEKFAGLWMDCGYAPETLLLENVRTSDLTEVWGVIQDFNLGICLDIGHVMAYDQYNLLEKEDIMDRTSLIHVYGREDDSGHAPLRLITDSGKLMLRRILSQIPSGSSVLIEVFHLEDFLDSKRILLEMADSWGLEFV